MSLSMRFGDQHLLPFGKNWLLFFIWGLALLILGIFAIAFATLSTLLTVVILGFVIFLSGAILLIDTFSFWWGNWGSFFIHLIIATLYLLVGIILMGNPVEGSISLTLLLGIFYSIAGIIRIGFSTTSRMPHWGWSLFNGIITLILGVLILANWPASSLFIIGLFVGIDLVFVGVSFMMAALTARRIALG